MSSKKKVEKHYGTATKIFTKKEYQDWSDKIWEASIEKGPDFLKDEENPYTHFMRGMMEIMQFTIWEAPDLSDVKTPKNAPKPVLHYYD